MWQPRACLLLLAILVPLSTARPQQHAGSNVESARLEANEAAFFAPGSWHPVIPSSKRDAAPRIHIDQDSSRIRGERGEILPRRKRQNEGSPTTVAAPVEEPRQHPTTALGDSIHKVTSQLLRTREPPKIKQEDMKAHQGVAVPVILDEDELDNMEKVEKVLLSNRNTNFPTDKPEPGLSTWVLLSGSSTPSTTPGKTTAAVKPTKKITPTPPSTTIKYTRTTTAATTTAPATHPKKTHITTTPKPKTTTVTKSDTAAVTTSPVTLPKKTHITTTQKPKTTTVTKSDTEAATASSAEPTSHKPNKVKTPPPPSSSSKNKTASTVDVPLVPAMTRKPFATTARPTELTTTQSKVQENNQENSVIVSSTLPPADVTDELSDESLDDTNSTETTTKRTRRPGTNGSKKKKNKNKRRKNRPNSSGGEPESKVTEDAASNSTKIATTKERPLSTRIYNYLAREVMPSVGVGLLGLVVTAGLAGLIMYPFGGGLAARRTYDEVPATVAPQGNFYYYNGDYDPSDDSGQAEEAVIQQVFEGMNKEEDEPSINGQSEISYDTSNGQYPSSATRYNSQDIQDSRIANGQVTAYAGDLQRTRYSGVGDTSTTTRRRGESTDTRRDSYFPSAPQEFQYPSSDSLSSQTNPEHLYSSDGTNYGRVRYREVGSSVESNQENKSADSTVVSTIVHGGSNPTNYNNQQDNNHRANSPVSSVVNGNGRVIFREVGGAGSQTVDLTATNTEENKNTKVNYGVGRVQFREVGGDIVTTASYGIQDRKDTNTPDFESGQVRYRNIGTHYTVEAKPTSGTVEQGPRSLRKKRATSDRKMKDDDDDMNSNEIDMEKSKNKNKPKKDQPLVKPTKIVKEEKTTEKPKLVSSQKPTTEPSTESETVVPTDVSEAEKTDEKQSAQFSEEIDATTEVLDDTTILKEEGTTKVAEETTLQPDDVTKIPDIDFEPELVTETHTPPPPFSIVNFVKQVAQFKIQFGLNFLKNTSQAFSRYLEQVQKRMQEAVSQTRDVQYRSSRDREGSRQRRARLGRLWSSK